MSKESIRQETIIAEPGIAIPKLATEVGVARAGGGNIILSFMCALPNEKANLIQRIALDKEALSQLIGILKNMPDE